MSEEDYKLSILIPTFNRLAYLKEAISSILTQAENKAIQLVVVDDGSTDGTYDYLLSLTKAFPFLEVAKHDENLGVGAARNTLLSLAQGRYLIFIDSDDLFLDGSLDKMFELVNSKEADVYVLNSYRQKGDKLKFKTFPENKRGLELLKAYIDGHFSEALYLVKTEFAKKIPVSPHLRVREDFAPKGCYLLHSSVKVVNLPFLIIRDHPQRLRKINNFYFEYALQSVEDLFNRLSLEYQGLKPYVLGKNYLELAKRTYQMGLYEEAKKFLKASKGIFPQISKDWRYLKLKLKLFLK